MPKPSDLQQDGINIARLAVVLYGPSAAKRLGHTFGTDPEFVEAYNAEVQKYASLET